MHFTLHTPFLCRSKLISQWNQRCRFSSQRGNICKTVSQKRPADSLWKIRTNKQPMLSPWELGFHSNLCLIEWHSLVYILWPGATKHFRHNLLLNWPVEKVLCTMIMLTGCSRRGSSMKWLISHKDRVNVELWTCQQQVSSSTLRYLVLPKYFLPSYTPWGSGTDCVDVHMPAHNFSARCAAALKCL